MKISDSHTDIVTVLPPNALEDFFKDNLDLNQISLAVFTYNKGYSLLDIKNFKDIIMNLSNKFNLPLLFSIEDCGFLDFDDLNKLIDLNPFSITLSWNNSNQYLGGASSDLGLTELGSLAINILEENKILVDTAHMSRRSFEEFTSITTRPIFNSHANINSIFNHSRNLRDDDICKIVNSDGYMGITLYSKFISTRQISSKDIAEQFNYVLSRFSTYHFGFGTDFFGVDPDLLPTDINNYNDLYLVANKLLDMGHSSKVVDRVMSENFHDFVSRTR